MRTALAHAGKSGHCVVSAFIATAFAQHDATTARTEWRKVADPLRPDQPKLVAVMVRPLRDPGNHGVVER